MNDAMTKSGVLVGIEMVVGQLMTSHLADDMDEISAVEIFEPVLIWLMSVRSTVEIGRRRVFNSVLVTSVLRDKLTHVTRNRYGKLMRYPSSLNMKGVMA